MAQYKITKSFARRGEASKKGAAVMPNNRHPETSVMRMFGVTADRLAEKKIVIDCQIEINEGDIVYITGPSGAGKSLLLKELERCIPASERVNLSRIKLPRGKSVIDCVAMPQVDGSATQMADKDVLGGLRLLSVAGLGDVFCIVNEVRNLSDGQRYRLVLAMALASGKRFIFADEFCCELDRICSAVISYNIHKFAKRSGVTFILAGANEDILADLSPDVIVMKDLSGETEVIYRNQKTERGTSGQQVIRAQEIRVSGYQGDMRWVRDENKERRISNIEL